LQRLRPLDPEADTPYVLETVRMLASELKVPLLAFAGAPFTVGSYLVEGKPSRDHVVTKQMMREEPELWNALMQRIAEHSVASIASQLNAGAQAFQLFDSWAGTLTHENTAPWCCRIRHLCLHNLRSRTHMHQAFTLGSVAITCWK
jgi:uroporphyrinogen decarboxylase